MRWRNPYASRSTICEVIGEVVLQNARLEILKAGAGVTPLACLTVARLIHGGYQSMFNERGPLS